MSWLGFSAPSEQVDFKSRNMVGTISVNNHAAAPLPPISGGFSFMQRQVSPNGSQ
jgi:hypothetical protein